MNLPRRIRLMTVLLLIAVGAIILFRLLPGETVREDSLRLSGNIEITDAEVSFRIPGHVVERPVREGDRVVQGTVVARLESADLEHEVGLRQAETESARAALAELTAGYRSEEIGQAEAALQQAEAELARAETEWRRDRELFNQGLVTARVADASRTAREVAQGRATEARAHLALLRKGYRPEQVAQARARLKAAEETLAQARTRLNYTVLTAPMAGVVLSENVEPGEFVAAGTPVVTLGRLDPVWLRGYIGESDLGRVKLGQPARVTTDTWQGKNYRGKVTFIAQEAEFTPKNVQTEKERTKLVYRIKITLPNPGGELKPGMPADAVLDLSGN